MCLVKENENNFAKTNWLFQNGKEKMRKTINRKLREREKEKEKRRGRKEEISCGQVG